MEIDEGRRAEYVRGEAPSACRFCVNAGVITVIGRLQDGFDALPASDEFRNAESISAPAFILPACEISDFSESEDDAIFASHDNHHRKLRSAITNGSGRIIERTQQFKELGTTDERRRGEDVEPHGRLDDESHAVTA
jgi:hypothetical protein